MLTDSGTSQAFQSGGPAQQSHAFLRVLSWILLICVCLCIVHLYFYNYSIWPDTDSHTFNLLPDTPSTHSIPEPSPLQGPSSAPVALVFICSGHNLCDQPGADGPVSISQSEPLAFLQNHRLAESERQWGVLTWHHHFLKESKKSKKTIIFLWNQCL